VTVVVTSTPAANDPDVQISFDSARAPDDATGIGAQTDKLTFTPGTNPPTIPPTPGTVNTATFTLNLTGSFQIPAYLDTNSNGVRDTNETGAALPSVLVQAALDSQKGNTSVPHEGLFTSREVTNAGGGVIGLQFRSASSPLITAPLSEAVQLQSQVNLVGGGPNGLRGLGQVFGAWVQVATTNPAATGSYQNGQNTHHMIRLEANGPASGNYNGYPVFEGTDVPSPVSAPLLDTAKPPPGVNGNSVGGNSSALMGNGPVTSTPLSSGIGQANTYLAVDSPGVTLPQVDIAFAQFSLTGITISYSFTDSLVLWSNVSASVQPTGDAFDHRYGLILQQQWTLSGALSVDANLDGTVTSSSVSLGQAAAYGPIVALPSTVIMLGPTTLSLLTWDARN
jgi:hypothetical protein